MPFNYRKLPVSLWRTSLLLSLTLMFLLLPKISYGQVTNRPNVVDANGKEWLQIANQLE
jgi:hypothetical protein